MRICLVSDNLVGYHETWSGAELVCQYLANLLKKGGQEVTFLTIKSKKENPEDIFPTPALTSWIWFFKKIFPIHIPIRTLVVFFQLKRIKPDIIHLFQARSLLIPVMLSAKILKIPTTFTVLDYFIICPTSHFRLKDGQICGEKEGLSCLKCVPLTRILERRIIRWLAKGSKKIITFTETSKQRLISHGFPAGKIKVKYIYEFASEISGKEVPLTKDILFIGSFRPQKGLDVLLQAMPSILKKIPDAKLTVIGRGNEPDKERIEILVQNLNIEKSIEFLGQKDNKETLEIVSRSKVVVVPEQWFSDFGPIALIEAMAQGRPVVASKIGSAPEFIKDGLNGFLAGHNQPEEFTGKIVWLLQNHEKAEEIGRKAKETVKSLFARNQSQEIVKLYTTI
jgi:glycosyltransferase involved in cell wall biosynthesis